MVDENRDETMDAVEGEDEYAPEEELEEDRGWTADAPVGEPVYIETGRGQTAEVQVGAPFVETVERIAEEAHYGGWFRVFLNGDELTEAPWLDDAHTELNPNYPASIEAGMRIQITSYDKVA